MNYAIMRGPGHIIIIIGSEAVIISQNTRFWLPRQSLREAKKAFGVLLEDIDEPCDPNDSSSEKNSILQFKFSSGMVLQVRYTEFNRLEFNLLENDQAQLPFAAAHIPISIHKEP